MPDNRKSNDGFTTKGRRNEQLGTSTSSTNPISYSQAGPDQPTDEALTTGRWVDQSESNLALSSSSGMRVTNRRRYKPIEREIPASYYSTKGNDAWLHKSQAKVVIIRETLKFILDHAQQDTRLERFGILLGGIYEDPLHGIWVEIVSMLPAQNVDASIAHVEVSIEEMSRINNSVMQVLDSSDQRIRKIGWYHTHPGHGVFMSHTDRNNQAQFYKEAWNVALVVDPIRGQDGVFVGPDSLFTPYQTVSLEKAKAAGSILLEVPDVDPIPVPIPPMLGPQPAIDEETPIRNSRNPLVVALLVLIALVVGALIGYLIRAETSPDSNNANTNNSSKITPSITPSITSTKIPATTSTNSVSTATTTTTPATTTAASSETQVPSTTTQAPIAATTPNSVSTATTTTTPATTTVASSETQATPPNTESPPPPKHYTIQSTDNGFFAIANKCGILEVDIPPLNPGVDSRKLYPGEDILVPANAKC
jgi:proteasome lid subunit RPN8/RPN11